MILCESGFATTVSNQGEERHTVEMTFPHWMRYLSQVTDNLGMAMIYTLHTSAKEWLRDKFGQDLGDLDAEDEDDGKPKDEVSGLP